jgi:octanoyl-[GcvH]:protein N-octanoyltransferase
MKNEERPLPPEIRVLDLTDPAWDGDLLVPFAVDELEIANVGRGAPPLLHFWVHRRGLAVGIRDAKLPGAVGAMEALERQGVRTAVRHSGGAAVPLDEGVLNVSLIVPKPPAALDFRGDFARMVALLQTAVRALGRELAQGEVAGSYCPGEFDLSIDGRKFCGIAQRRQTKAIAVQAFVVVEGRGEERLAQARAFYDRAVGDAARAADRCDRRLCYPKLKSGTVASLAESGMPGITVERFKAEVLDALSELGAAVTDYARAVPYDPQLLAETAAAIRRRYAAPSG